MSRPISSVTYCLNPDCKQHQNLPNSFHCNSCGAALLLGDRYRPLRPLASGGFGRTFLAVDEREGCRCVVKQFVPPRSRRRSERSRTAAELFRAEAERLRELGRHPQIPALYDYIERDGYQFIVQEYVEGENLATMLAREGPFRERDIRKLLLGLLPVLEFVHQQRVIHRDIKPENIIRCRGADGDRLTLVDFGVAKYATETALGRTGTLVGSAGYAAPEQIYGKPVFASDLYALGVTCLHLLTQMEPFDLYDPVGGGLSWRQYLTHRPVSADLGTILDRLTATATRDRSPTAAAALRDLQQPTRRLSPLARRPRRRQPQSRILKGNIGAIASLAFAPDGRTLAAGGNRTAGKPAAIALWDPVSSVAVGRLSSSAARVSALAFAPNGKQLAAVAGERAVRIWDLTTGDAARAIAHPSPVTTVQFCPQGEKLLTGSTDGLVRLWDKRWEMTRTGLERSWFINPGAGAIRSLAISPDGTLLAIGTDAPGIQVWAIPSRPETGMAIASELNRTLQGHADSIAALAFAPDGTRLASSSGDWDGSVKLWDVRDGCLLATLSGCTGMTRALAFTPDGRTLATAGDDRVIRLWDARTGRSRTLQLKGHIATVNALAFSPDGRMLASGSNDETVRLWTYF
ncbi:WD40 repeat-containing protein [Rubidibacter lacunae KORDI 51-2]|uniref:WD40 repeat-containing protein n=1 Tax=Rubidibacter lacunae KORDI 51-2 TaxID=582515 RepID=U5DM95_9CHRO|nr:serine/threonine-protein kinase [Rubidibacter lacunae]ERN41997.1 WD40 repeat-containing protein [Rubidibacter lacunae KORDI 51-2]